ncbi:MAG: hypothetical protein QOK35_143 [Pseudonocardiales bacterium]|nr:hypothetical protein [Pseudonocardiales bacterium]
MRTVYRVLAWLVAVEVLVQAAVIAWAVFGLGQWIQGGGVLDKSVMESEVQAFPAETGFMLHGINGEMVVPVLALLLLVVSFFAKVPRGVALAGGVVGLVAVQVALGLLGRGLPWLGLLHGANALALVAVAVVAARLPSPTSAPYGASTTTGRHGAATPF